VGSSRQGWQSKLLLLLVLPWTAVSVVVQAREWLTQDPAVAWWAVKLQTVWKQIPCAEMEARERLLKTAGPLRAV